MKKKIIIIISIILVLIICVFFVVPRLFLGKINYKAMNEDMRSIKKNQTIKNAKLVDKKHGASRTYKGDGYLIKEFYGGEVIEYVIYVNNKEIWHYSKVYPLEAR